MCEVHCTQCHNVPGIYQKAHVGKVAIEHEWGVQ